MAVRPRDDAPFRRYKKTDAQAFDEGYSTGLGWPAGWAHVPGGPYVPKLNTVRDHPDWQEYCRVLERHNRLWLDGWHKGVKEAAKTNRDLRQMLNNLVYIKLSR